MGYDIDPTYNILRPGTQRSCTLGPVGLGWDIEDTQSMGGVRPKGTDRSPWKDWPIRTGMAESALSPQIARTSRRPPLRDQDNLKLQLFF